MPLRRFISVVALLALPGLTANEPAAAMSIRDDLPQSFYEDLLATPPLDASGRFNGLGSGTLIQPTWVVTAAHTGNTGTFNTLAGSSATLARIVFPGDPGPADALDGYDFALFALADPITGVSTAELYRGTPAGLDNQVAHYAGGGDTGEGDSGADGPRRLLAGTNRIDQVGVDVTDNNVSDPVANLVLSDFDDPNAGGGFNSATPLEMGLAGGDSGGGLFVDAGSGLVLAGVHSAVSKAPDDPFGLYGQFNLSSAFTPDVLDWIDAVTAHRLGDLDGDGDVDVVDLDRFGTSLLSGGGDLAGDLDGDGVVDVVDLDLFGTALLNQGSGNAPLTDSAALDSLRAAVPEPGTLALVLAGMAAAARRRNRGPGRR